MKIKKMFYLIPLNILFIIFTISIPTTFVTAKDNTYNKQHLIAKLKDENIYLYYDKKTSTGMFEGFYLKSGDKVQYFNWKSIDKEGFYPTISLIKDNYIAVVCTIGEGSGLDIQQLYLINKNTFKKLTYKNPINVVKSNVTSDIKAPDVTIKIGNNTWSSTYLQVKKLSNFYDTVGYENMITYDVQDTYFTISLRAQVTPGLFIGNFKIKYLWDEKKSKFTPTKINFNFNDITVDNINLSNMKSIASIPEEKIYLYASNKENTMYKGLVLSINGVNKLFDWETISLTEDLPKLYYIDLNDDQKKELVIFLSKGGGTGSIRKTIHIINPKDFTEYNIEDPQNIIKNQVEATILSEKKVEIKINNKKSYINIDNIPPKLSGIYPDKISEITYEDYIDYEIIDNKIRGTVGVEGDFLKYIGYIVIDYTFKDDQFEASNIQFKELK